MFLLTRCLQISTLQFVHIQRHPLIVCHSNWRNVPVLAFLFENPKKQKRNKTIQNKSEQNKQNEQNNNNKNEKTKQTDQNKLPYSQKTHIFALYFLFMLATGNKLPPLCLVSYQVQVLFVTDFFFFFKAEWSFPLVLTLILL